MTTQAEIAERILRSLRVLGAGETAEDDDLGIAMRATNDAHNLLKVAKLLRWPLNDIPEEVATAYVNIGCAMCASDFLKKPDLERLQAGVRHAAAYIQIPISEITTPVDF